MGPALFLKLALRRSGRMIRLTCFLGIIPLLVTGCLRGAVVIDHLDIQSGWARLPSLRLGSGDSGLFCSVSPSQSTTWSVNTWHDYDLDARNLILFVDIDTRGPGFEITVGYFGLILLSGAILSWIWWRGRRPHALPAGGFEIQPGGGRIAPPTERSNRPSVRNDVR